MARENISEDGTGVRLGKLKREEKLRSYLRSPSEVEVDAFMPTATRAANAMSC